LLLPKAQKTKWVVQRWKGQRSQCPKSLAKFRRKRGKKNAPHASKESPSHRGRPCTPGEKTAVKKEARAERGGGRTYAENELRKKRRDTGSIPFKRGSLGQGSSRRIHLSQTQQQWKGINRRKACPRMLGHTQGKDEGGEFCRGGGVRDEPTPRWSSKDSYGKVASGPRSICTLGEGQTSSPKGPGASPGESAPPGVLISHMRGEKI